MVRRDSNPRSPAPKADALPTELSEQLWLSGRVLDSRPRGSGLKKTIRLSCLMPLSNELKKHVQIIRVKTRENPGYYQHLKKWFQCFEPFYWLEQLQGSHTLFGNGAGAHGIWKISSVLTNIGKFDIVLFHC